MNNFIDKLENYLFDFVGLILPGAYLFCCIFLMKIAAEEYDLRDDLFISNLVEFIVSAQKLFKEYLGDYFIFGALIIFFLLGHPIKILAKHFYKFGQSLIDKWILEGYRIIRNKSGIVSGFDGLLAKFHVKYILKDFLKFSSPNLHPVYGSYKDETLRLVKKQYNVNLENGWYPLYKLGTTIIANEKLNSMHQLYLAKYNLYRSLAFISFSFGLLFFFSLDISNLNTSNSLFITLINFSFFGLWFAFHAMYKRYWMLDGSDTLINLFYYLKKNED